MSIEGEETNTEPEVDLESVLCFLWLTLVLGSLLVSSLPSSMLGFVTEHGKMQNAVQDRKRSESLSLAMMKNSDSAFIQDLLQSWDNFAQFRVRKDWFMHFYIVGAVNGMIWMVASYSFFDVEHDGMIKKYTFPAACLFSAFLWELHVLRRLYECLYITHFGDSMIHISGYAVGIIHYLLVPATLLLPCFSPSQYNRHLYSSLFSSRILLSCGVFALANYYQYKCHLILFRCKQRATKENITSVGGREKLYMLPTGSLFEYVSCPHYFTEICIYLTMMGVQPSSLSVITMNVWVICNLSVVSYKQYLWYLDNFFADFDNGKMDDWRILIPFVW